MKDGLGVTLEEICKIAPGGILVFFPSYKLLEKLHRRWTQTGQWSRLNAEKPLFVGMVLENYVFIVCSSLCYTVLLSILLIFILMRVFLSYRAKRSHG